MECDDLLIDRANKRFVRGNEAWRDGKLVAPLLHPLGRIAPKCFCLPSDFAQGRRVTRIRASNLHPSKMTCHRTAWQHEAQRFFGKIFGVASLNLGKTVRRFVYFSKTFFMSPSLSCTLPSTLSAVPRSRKSGL